MESSERPGRTESKLLTPARLLLTTIALALLATFSLSGCNSASAPMGNSSASNSSTTKNGPDATMTVNGAKANTSQPAQPMAVPLPDLALNTGLKGIDGKEFKIADLNGKVLVIDLWATWCGPCRYEVPELVKLQSEYGPRGFEVIGLDIDPKSDSPEDVKDFMKEYKINYKVAFVAEDLARALMKGGNIPQSLVVGRDGKIIKHFIGYNQERTPVLMRDAIETALK